MTVVLAMRGVRITQMYNSSPSSRKVGQCIVVHVPATFIERIGFPDAAPLVRIVTDSGSVPVVQSGRALVAANHGYPKTRSSGPMSAI